MKTLVIGLNWLGDIIMSFPALALDHERTPTTLSVVTRPHLAAAYLLHPHPLDVIPLDTSQSLWAQIPTIRRLRREQYDQIIVFPRSFRTAFIARLCGGTTRIGFAAEGRSWLLHQALPLPEDLVTRHESTLYQILVREAGLTCLSECPSARLPSAPQQEELFTRLGLKRQRYLVLAPGAAFGPAKRWPPQHFREIAQRWVREYQTPVVLTGSVGEAELTSVVRNNTSDLIIDLAGKTSIAELTVLLSQATAMIANDSGTMHLGALTRTPMVIPIGPTTPERTGPLSDCATLVRARRDHEPCRQRTCPRQGLSCLEQLPPDEVWAALQARVRQP
ncbi:MAG TPA: lipopolysaccharide heptosyltransferase II [Candidatus Ozemobacteraceae bacterium]|nr:lipopolysaccharide heptosyltransferase II [Candidatus Ozemobacteraceae bacterium]